VIIARVQFALNESQRMQVATFCGTRPGSSDDDKKLRLRCLHDSIKLPSQYRSASSRG